MHPEARAGRRVLLRTVTVLSVVGLATLAAPSLAFGSTASMSDGALTYAAAAGEANHVIIVEAGGSYRVVDTGATITPGTGCSAVSSNEVVCAIPPSPALTGVTVTADDLDDFVSVNAFARTIVNGEAGLDELVVDAPDLTCEVNCFENRLDGGAGNDVLRGGRGSQLLIGGAGADEFHGGPGFSVADYSARSAPITGDVDGAADDGEAGENDNLVDVSGIIGGSADDILSAGGLLRGHGGKDMLTGTSNDFNQMFGGGSDDVLRSLGGSGSFSFMRGGSGEDRLIGGPGDEEMAGGPGDDRLRAGGSFDFLSGEGGDDVLRGQEGRDEIVGGPGDDLVLGGLGRDRLGGGLGADTLRARDGVRDRVSGGPGNDRAHVDVGLDQLFGVEVLF